MVTGGEGMVAGGGGVEGKQRQQEGEEWGKAIAAGGGGGEGKEWQQEEEWRGSNGSGRGRRGNQNASGRGMSRGSMPALSRFP